MSAILCARCGKGCLESPLYRVNAKGAPGIFKHAECGAEPDKDTLALAQLIHTDGNKDVPPAARQDSGV